MKIADQLTRLLSQGVTGNQARLVEKLRQAGVETTQSSVSRALKKINAVKGVGRDGQTRYTLPMNTAAKNRPGGDKGLFGALVHKILENGQMIVVHTRPGTAPTVAKVIDDHGFEPIMGTVAGDDTIMIVPVDIRQTRRLTQEIQSYLIQVGLF